MEGNPFKKRINELIQSGVIVVTCRFSRTGSDIWAYSVQPHPRLGVDTHTGYSLDEVTEIFKNFSVVDNRTYDGSLAASPKDTLKGGKLVLSSGGIPISDVKSEKGPSPTMFPSLTEAIRYSDKNRLGEVKKGNTWNYLDKSSLTPADFEGRGLLELFARAVAVADNLSTPVIVSRINTQAEELRLNGVSNLTEWWDAADGFQRIRVLSRTKRWGKSPSCIAKAPSTYFEAISCIPCPFRDAWSQVYQEEEGDQADFTPSDDDVQSEAS
jgi:hypothetical protein